MHQVMCAGCVLGLALNHDRCRRQRRCRQLVGMQRWHGLPGAELGVRKRVFDFLGEFGDHFQNWLLLV